MQRSAVILNHKIIRAVESFLVRVVDLANKYEYLTHRNAIMDVLNRVATDETFRKALFNSGTETLEQYELNWEEKAALLSGDIEFIEKKTGPLTPAQKSWLLHRLEAEVW